MTPSFPDGPLQGPLDGPLAGGMARSLRGLYAVKALLAATLLLGACVTINVYFPAAAAEKAADRIIDQVYGSGGAAPAAPAAPATDDKRTNLLPEYARPLAHEEPGLLLAAAGRVLDFLVPPAHAQAADLNVSTPAIRALVSAMEGRNGQLSQYYTSGAVGPTADGMVEVRDQNAIPLAERNAVRKLVADENADRLSLYTEIANANGNPSWVADIRNTFGRRWIDKAQAGWWYKDSGGWKQK
jgi:uncharacterized protein YdbL (DUF1318 family)